MRYFTLQTQTLFLESMQIYNWRETINTEWLCLDKLYKIPKRIVLPVTIKEFFPFPDIITVPFLMVSELVYRTVKMYGDMIYTRDVILVDRINHNYKRYYLLVLEQAENKRIPIQECNIFYRNMDGEKKLLVSLDFAESILRRGAAGIWIGNVDLKL